MKSADVILPFIQNKINHAAWLPANALEVVAATQPDWAGVLGIGYLSETATAGGMPVKSEKRVKPNYDKYPGGPHLRLSPGLLVGLDANFGKNKGGNCRKRQRQNNHHAGNVSWRA